LIVLIAVAAAGMLFTACTPAAEKLNNEGNSKFAEEAYLEALAAYQNALVESPELAEPYYNAANALYREGAYPEALALMQQALSYADDESLAESGFYNMGNSSFGSEDWESAVAAYRDALLLNPDDQDAKYNLELALQQLEQQQQEEEEQEQEQEQNEEEQEQDQNGEGEENEEEQEQSEDGQNQDGENNQEEEQEKSENGEGEEENDQQQEQQDPSQNGQDEHEQNQDQEGSPEDGAQDGEPQPGQAPAPGQRMTEEQARQLLAAIAGDSDTLQERLGQIFVAPPIPPVQDW
jgi:hypothetical protein